MESIFIIRSITNDYDCENGIVGWVETKEQAIEKTNYMNEVHELAQKYKEKIWEHRQHLYDIVPKEETETEPSYPKWPAGIAQKDITQEMRDERERIKKLQSEIRERNNVKYEKRGTEISKLSQEFIDSLNLSPEVLEELNVEHVSRYDWFELEKLSIKSCHNFFWI